jgi:FtsP/CotA-like multicopper oxidase with cupredoxin domain
VDIVVNNLDEEGHPFHLHGYDFWVLSTYSSTYNWGSYNPFEDEEAPGGPYNTATPVKKDTVLVPRRGYAVLRLRADNPGIWMFHCHNVGDDDSFIIQ